jgi:hypothetical protein
MAVELARSAEQRPFRDGRRNSGSFAAFRVDKNGDLKMDRRDQELLDKQMRRLNPPRNDGVIAMMLADARRGIYGPRRCFVCAPK